MSTTSPSVRILGTTALGITGATVASGAHIVTTFDTPVLVNTSIANAAFSFDGGPGGTPIHWGVSNEAGTDVSVSFAFNNSTKPTIQSFDGARLFLNSEGNVARLPEGFEVGPSHSSAYSYDTANTGITLGGVDWPVDATSRGFVGLSFINASSNPRYGWLDLELVSGTAMYIHALGYESSGASVFAGADPTPVPEPANAGLAAALLAGSTVLMRRRRSGS